MIEAWKDVSGYDGIYQVSNLGNIKNKVKIINGGYRRGYKTIKLWKNGSYKNFSHHQLVAMAFLGHKPNGNNLVVDHINNVRDDNRVENLQIISNRENMLKDRKKSLPIGVYENKHAGGYYSRININGQDVYLGRFKTVEACGEAYQNAYNGKNTK